jgi:hypothetical protein
MYLLNLSKTKIEVFKNNIKISEVSWTKENLSQTLTRLKETFSSRFRILLSDDFISITSLLVSKKESKKRKLIQIRAQLVIAQNLDQTVWDYKIVANQGKLKLIQIIYLDKTFFDQFRTAVNNAKIKIKLIESLSTSICRFLPKNKLIFLLYYNLVVISYNQTPIFSKILDKKLTQSDVEEIFAYTKERFKTFPQQIIFSPTGDTAFTPYDFSSLTPEYLDINPIRGLIHSDNVVGSDDSTSRLEIKSPSPVVINSSFPKKIVFILAISIFVLLLLIFGQKFLLTSRKTNNSGSTAIISSILTPTPIPTINLDSYKIQVLNGSGIAGEATKISTLLSENKLKVAKTGNATNYDYVKTEIQTKKRVPISVVDIIIKSFAKEYVSTISATKLDDSYDYDINIITGKPN